jgi:lysophospholipase L1-like esterase
MKPLKILFFTLGVFLLLAGTMWITPADGVKLGAFTFHMPTFREMLVKEEVGYADVSEILEQQFDIDSLVDIGLATDTVFSDSAAEIVPGASYDSLVASICKIEMGDTGKINLHRFFQTLHDSTLVRIMHYGDSQIEGDRITAFIRNKFQVKFGGSGPGLRPALQPYDYIFSAVQENSGNWKRYPVYGKVDSTVGHDRYGVMGAFSRFAPPASDTLPFRDSLLYEAGLSISKSGISYQLTRRYKHFRMFYGNAKRPVEMQLVVKGDTFFTGTLPADLDYGLVECDLPDSTSHISIHFSGYDSPDIYGIELAGQQGVIVDNIALRGSSGTIFTKTDYIHSLKMYNDLKPGLFLLQFGGNVMPYIKDKKAIKNYGRWFKSQILRLQMLCPDAAIIVIGPSDMSTKVKDKYVTYDYLPDVVETLREAALSTGCGFWNMYEAMGGYNSMPSWVNADPGLARPDYVHFSARGARLVANMFYNALIFEYNNFLMESN